jgi:hypothetical protein
LLVPAFLPVVPSSGFAHPEEPLLFFDDRSDRSCCCDDLYGDNDVESSRSIALEQKYRVNVS